MGDYPIWVNDPLIDSPAVLSTVINLCALFPEASRKLGLDQLPAVIHRCPEFYLPPPLPVPSKACVDPTCRRCTQRIGGYSFRWSHLLFRPIYQLNMRPGASQMTPVIGLKHGTMELLFLSQWHGRDLLDTNIPQSMPGESEIVSEDPREREALLRMPVEAYQAMDEEREEEAAAESMDLTTGWTAEMWRLDAEMDDIPHRIVRERNRG